MRSSSRLYWLYMKTMLSKLLPLFAFEFKEGALEADTQHSGKLKEKDKIYLT